MFWIFRKKFLLHSLSQQHSVTEHKQNDELLVWMFGLVIFNVTCNVQRSKQLSSWPSLGILQSSILSLPCVVSSAFVYSGVFSSALQCAVGARLLFSASLNNSIQFLFNVAFLETCIAFLFLYRCLFLGCYQMLKIALKKGPGSLPLLSALNCI